MKILKKCQALNNDGKRCKEIKKLNYEYFHGDAETEQPTKWVAVYLCKKHMWPYSNNSIKSIS